MHTVAEKCDCRRKRRDNGDSLTFLRRCGQGLTRRNMKKVKFTLQGRESHYKGKGLFITRLMRYINLRFTYLLTLLFSI